MCLSCASVSTLAGSGSSLTFDKNQDSATIRFLPHLFRHDRNRSLADLRAVHVVTFTWFTWPVGTHVRLVFAQSEPHVVEVTGYRKREAAIALAQQLSMFLGVPLREVAYRSHGRATRAGADSG